MGQIARLENELSRALLLDLSPRRLRLVRAVASPAPRMLSTGELERIRDALVERLAVNRQALSRRTEARRRAGS